MTREQLKEFIANEELEISDIIEMKLNGSCFGSLLVVGETHTDVYVQGNVTERISSLKTILNNNKLHWESTNEIDYSVFRLIDKDNLQYAMGNFIEIVEHNNVGLYYYKLEEKHEDFNIAEHISAMREYLEELIDEKKKESKINHDYIISTTTLSANKVIFEVNSLPF